MDFISAKYAETSRLTRMFFSQLLCSPLGKAPPFLLDCARMSLSNQPLIIAGRIFRSRLILGTGKFSSPETMRDALEASGAELVTVALRRADLSGKKDP